MPRHTRGDSEPQRLPTRRGTQSRSDRGRAAGREPRTADEARDTRSQRRDGAGKTARGDDDR